MLKDYKVKIKKIAVILFPNIKWIKPRVYKYKDHEIYEDLYSPYDFYMELKNGWVAEGSYKQMTQRVNNEQTGTITGPILRG